MSIYTDIFNGARCKSYKWSQSHNDLEIRVKVDKSVRQEDVHVDIATKDICVEVASASGHGSCCDALVDGEFMHSVDVDSVCWHIEIEKGETSIVIYVDKMEEIWWKKLLIDEETVEYGVQNYNIPIEQLDGSSRMVIDKLVKEQQQKRLDRSYNKMNEDAHDSPV